MSRTDAAAPLRWSLGSWMIYVSVPVLLVLGMLVAEYAGGDVKRLVLDSPVGVRESLTGVLTFSSAIIALVALRQRDRKLKVWLLLYAIGMIYFLGEDLNWGQYYFDRCRNILPRTIASMNSTFTI
jgi:hypothetical protein